MLLTAGACGVAAALQSQPLELPWLREFIRTQLSDGVYPQMILRLGVVIQTAVGVRRPLADVLFSPGDSYLITGTSRPLTEADRIRIQHGRSTAVAHGCRPS